MQNRMRSFDIQCWGFFLLFFFLNLKQYETCIYLLKGLKPIAARTTLYSYYFLSSTVKSWNSQTIELQNNQSLPAFKNNFKSNREIKPVFYYCGSRSGQIYHARIRMNCSRLNKHLYDRNLIQSPKCVCWDPETTEHYLLKCKIFNVPRQRHIHNLQIPIKISTNVLLFGSDKLTVEQNILIFKAVQKFIISSNRFTSTIK